MGVIAGLSTSAASGSVENSLNTAIGDGSLFSGLAADISAIPGIETVTEGTIGVELVGSIATDDDKAKAKLVGSLVVGVLFLLICCSCAAGIYCLACRCRKDEGSMAEP